MHQYEGRPGKGARPPRPLLPHLEHQLAPQVAGLADAMGCDGIGQAIKRDLGRADGARPDQFDDALEMRAIAPDRRTQRAQVTARRWRRLRTRPDEGRPTTRLEHRKRFLRHSAADGIEDGVAVGNDLGEVGGGIVDDFVGTDCAEIVVVFRPRRGDDAGADVLCKLNGEARDAAGAALDQDRLAGFQLQCIFDGNQCGEARERKPAASA